MSCSRRWEVEAARDGRLGERERKAHVRHLVECVDCRREQRELEELRAGLRAVVDHEVSQPGVRHGRKALLERALAERNRHAEKSPGRGRPLSIALVAAALGLALWFGLRPAWSPAIVVEAARGTSYRRYQDAGRPVIQLDSGRLSIKVQHSEGEPRLRVLTPDGELEDIGTTFTIEVKAGRTELVAVVVGLVRVSITGQPVAMVEPGQRYRPYAAASVVAAGPTRGSEPSGPSPQPPEPNVSAEQRVPPMPREKAAVRTEPALLSLRAHAKPVASLSKAQDGDAGDESSPPARAFAQAVRTLERGETVEAARRFKAFVQTFPSDLRAEDAGYLRVVAWLRAGKSAEARSAAAEFLRRYPQGFRRQDVERLLSR
jgi:hypothetical protein